MAEHRLRPFGGAILLHQIKTRQRHIKPCPFGVLQQHELRRAITLIDFFQTLVLADSVLHVNHVVAHLKITEIRKKCGDLGLLPLRPRDYSFRFVK